MWQITTIIALFLVGYAYIGYPVVLAIWSRYSGRDLLKKDSDLTVSIILPVFNEQDAVIKRIENLLSQDYNSGSSEILVVDDGSTDATRQRVREYPSTKVHLLSYNDRRGKSHAINYAASQATGEVLVLTDARAQFESNTISELLSNFIDPEVGAATGVNHVHNRGIGENENLYWRYESWIKKNESRLHSTCAVTGSIVAIRSTCFNGIPEHIINDDAYLNLDVIKQGYRFICDDQAHCTRAPAKSIPADRVRRWRIAAGRFQLLAKVSLWPWHNFKMLICYWSHKFLRLLLGPILLVGLIANAMAVIDDPKNVFFSLLLLTQILFYILALAGAKQWPLPRLLRKLAKTTWLILEINFSGIWGLMGYLKGTQTVLWTKAQKSGSGGSE